MRIGNRARITYAAATPAVRSPARANTLRQSLTTRKL